MLIQRVRVKALGDLSKAKAGPLSEEEEVQVVVRYVE
jgi:hypothetical protein